MRQLLLSTVVLSLVSACGEYPEVTSEALLSNVDRQDVTYWSGALYYFRDGSVLRWDGTASSVEVSGITEIDTYYEMGTRFFADDDGLWVRAVTERGGPDVVLERTEDGTWVEVDLPVTRVSWALPGADAWLSSAGLLYHRQDGVWTDVPLDGRARQIARAAGQIYVHLASESSGSGDSVARWDGDGWTTFALPDGAQSPLLVVDGEICARNVDGSMQSIERPAERLPAPPSVPDRDPWNAARRYAGGTDDSLLWLQSWTVHPERTGRYDEYTAVDRFQNGSWAPVALLEGHPATVLDLGGGLLLVEGPAWDDGGWQLIRPAL